MAPAAVAGGSAKSGAEQGLECDVRERQHFDLLKEYDEVGTENSIWSFWIRRRSPKTATSIPAAQRGYKEINLRALKLLRPGGYLVTCSCSYHVTEPLFLQIVAEAANDAKKSIVVAERRTQAQDHPILLTMPETHYLKCLIARVID